VGRYKLEKIGIIFPTKLKLDWKNNCEGYKSSVTVLREVRGFRLKEMSQKD